MSEWGRYSIRQLVGAPLSGKRPAGGVNAETEGIPSLGGENIRANGGMDYGTINRVPVDFFRSMPKGRLQANDVLINKDGAQTGKVGLYDGRFEEAAVNEHVFILRSSSGAIDQRLLYYFLLLPDTQLRIARRITGSAQPGLNSQFADAVHLTVPSERAEQRWIAEILTTVDEAIEHTEALIAKTQQIKAGLMHDLFTRGVTADGELRPPREEAPQLYKESPLGWIPKEWDVATLNDLVSPARPIVYGILMPGRGHPGGIPVIKVKDIVDGQVQGDDLLLTSPRIDAEYQRSKVRPRDVLLTIRGTVGRLAQVPMHLDGANITQDTARIAIAAGSPEFYRYYLETHAPRRHFAVNTLGQAVQGINLRDVRTTPVPIVSDDEQGKIAEMVVAVGNSERAEREHLAKLVQAKQGLMQDLLSGRVPVTASAEPCVTEDAANV